MNPRERSPVIRLDDVFQEAGFLADILSSALKDMEAELRIRYENKYWRASVRRGGIVVSGTPSSGWLDAIQFAVRSYVKVLDFGGYLLPDGTLSDVLPDDVGVFPRIPKDDINRWFARSTIPY